MQDGRPEARPSIHRNHDEDPKDKEVLRHCNICKAYFLVHGGEVQTKLDENRLKEHQELHKGPDGIYPDLTKVAPFTCASCTVPSSASVTVKPNKEWWTLKIKASASLLVKIKVPAVLSILVVVASIYLASCYFYPDYRIDDAKPVPILDIARSSAEETFDDAIYMLEKNYTLQEERTWFTLSAGVKAVLWNNQPAVFLMLYLDEAGAKTSECLAKDVSRAATKYLTKQEKEPLIVSDNELGSAELKEEPGKLLTLFKERLSERIVMIVKRLQNVPPVVAKNFHFMCDKYSPLVEKAVYFFTLKVDSLPAKKEVLKFTESRLRELWSASLQDNVLDPLITRMTPSIVKVYSESSTC